MAEQTAAGRTDETTATKRPGPPAAGPRRLLVGLNVIVSTLLVVGLVVAANFIAWWATERYGLTADLTQNRRFSFSSRTQLLLGKLDGPVRLTSLFAARPKDKEAEERKRQVEDLLQQYQRNGHGQVEMALIDPTEQPGELYALTVRITKAYSKEAESYIVAIQKFVKLKAEAAKLLLDEKQRYEAVSRDPAISPEMKTLMQEIVLKMRELTEELDALDSKIEIWTAGAVRAAAAGQKGEEPAGAEEQQGAMGIPDYREATSRTGSLAQGLAEILDLIGQSVDYRLKVEGVKVPEAVRRQLEGADQRYKAVKEELLAISKQLSELKPLELESVRDSLAVNSVVVEAAGGVRVVGYDELFPTVAGPQRMDPTTERRFNGEDAVSAAILRLVSKERVAVVFVKWGGMPVGEAGGEYSDLAERLKRANFVVENWDLAHLKAPPKPEGTVRSVYVLLPPEPPNQQMPTPPASPEAYHAVRDLLAAGENFMIFLQPHVEGMLPEAPYLDWLKDFGLVGKTDYLAVVSQEDELGQKRVEPAVRNIRYPSQTNDAAPHAIIKPLEGLAGLFPFMTVVEASAAPPAGVKIWPLIETPRSQDCWADKDIMQAAVKHTGTFDPGQDLPSPFMVAAAAVRPVAASPAPAGTAAAPGSATALPSTRQSRLVVFGSPLFAYDDYAGPQPTGMTATGRIVVDYPFPANGEIVVNSMLWLSNQEEMIAASPQAQESRRIVNINKTLYAIYQWGLPAGLPLIVIVLGIAVYFVRLRVR